ncbi:hypothetical protein CWI36_1951p0010 [Hamiltosporidium magnivora]|uniref:Elongator complex protein 2 n=1 Tax=Hamiltosporidium magnivora TaxID=148818 RepID=A0A4Q9KZ56_9MICR|nr:hypothetical protein CWI36_1951p0010 [Hamiltosporidium magnivora]
MENIFLAAGSTRRNHVTCYYNDTLIFAAKNNIILLKNKKEVIITNQSLITVLNCIDDMIIAGDDQGNINVYDFYTHKQLKTFKLDDSVQLISKIPHKDIYICGSFNKLYFIESKAVKYFEIKNELITCGDIFYLNNEYLQVTGTYSGNIIVFQINNSNFTPKLTFNAHKDSITTIKCHYIKEDIYFLTASQDKFIKIWKINRNENGDKLFIMDHTSYSITLVKTLSGHRDWIYNCIWTEEDDIYSVSQDDSCILWKYKNNDWSNDIRLGGIASKNQGFFDIVKSKDSIFCLSYFGGFYKYTSNSLVYCTSGHQDEITSLDWYNNYLLSTSLDSTARIFNINSQKEIARAQIHGYPLKVARFLKKDTFSFISAGQETQLRVFQATQIFIKNHEFDFSTISNQSDLKIYKPKSIHSELSLTNEISNDYHTSDLLINEYTLTHSTLFHEISKIFVHYFEIEDIAVSPYFIASVNRSSSLDFSGIFITSHSFQKLNYIKVHRLGIQRIRFSSQFNYLMAVSRDKTASIYKVTTTYPYISLLQTFTDHKRCIWDCSFSPTENLVATVSRDKKVFIYQIPTLKLIFENTFTSEATTISFGNKILAIGTENGEIFLYTFYNQIVFHSKIQAHTNRINVLEFDQHGTRLATGGKDSLIQVFQISI